MPCYDEGALRAYLDDSLSMAERHGIAAHISACAECRGLVEEQRRQMAQVASLLAPPAAMPDPQLALARFRQTRSQLQETAQRKPHPGDHTQERQPPAAGRWWLAGNTQLISRRSIMQTASRLSGPRRTLLAGIVTLVLLISLLALPPVRAAADQLLQIFRVQKVVFVPISPERIDELKQLNFDPKTLFTKQPEGVGEPAEPHTVASPEAAAAEAGITILQPTVFPNPPRSTEILVHDRRAMSFQVDVESARQLLGLLGIDDVTLPDALGAAPIAVEAAPIVETSYRGDGYELTLIQGRSPSVSLPDGVDMAQLGKAALRVLGLDADKAEQLSQQIDWNNTLVVPFPSDISNVRQVQVGDAPGLLVGSNERGRGWNLYWQNSERLTVLQGRGSINEADMIAAAESVR